MAKPLQAIALVMLVSMLGAQRAQAVDPPRDPERVYASACHYCHDSGIGKPIRGTGLAPIRIKLAVRQGYVAMPSFAPSTITDAELAALVKLLETPVAPAAERRP